MCCVCGRKCFGQEVKIQANPAGYFGLWRWQFGINKKIKVPAHTSCGKALKNSLFFRTFILLIIAFITLSITIYFHWGKLELLSLGAILLTPPVLWQFHNPPHIEFTSERNVDTYSFLNEEYAKKFAALNHATIVDYNV